MEANLTLRLGSDRLDKKQEAVMNITDMNAHMQLQKKEYILKYL